MTVPNFTLICHQRLYMVPTTAVKVKTRKVRVKSKSVAKLWMEFSTLSREGSGKASMMPTKQVAKAV